ncbi:GAF and ANTAR domain-containing protein [Humibacillus xanthopallidus]|uniref:ANTAR domain-containing protein n=1 Tax=Humibacillus xanthopallidus TaxID=412689 RepID=A0A543HUE6_9MICO|nr:GAF and ANTAR domain-containing protein [Humibacillus xanthopallidus]TQM61976.1 ANTAR domain-containing protein [Humibacillus xanthopallidus]
MEPIPETQAALDRLAHDQDDDVQAQFSEMAAKARRLVPSLVGLSVTQISEGVTLTYVASPATAVALDALQYVDGGPCEAAVRRGAHVAVDHDELLDEGRWQLFAQASAHAGVRSTLSLPVFSGSDVTGGVNLYGSLNDSFVGHHEALAALFGAWAAGAISNADLSFSSRLEAMEAPARIEDANTVSAAIGVLSETHQISTRDAEDHLRRAAARAGVPIVALALFILHPPQPS